MRKLLLSLLVVLVAQTSFAAISSSKVKAVRENVIENSKQRSGESVDAARTRLASHLASMPMFSIGGKNISHSGLQKLVTYELSTESGDYSAINLMIRLAMQAADSSQGVQQKVAADQLEVLSHMASTLKPTGSKESRIAKLEEITKLSENVSSLTQGNSQIGKNWAETFIDLIKTPGTTLDMALDAANQKTGKQITKEQILNCKKG